MALPLVAVEGFARLGDTTASARVIRDIGAVGVAGWGGDAPVVAAVVANTAAVHVGDAAEGVRVVSLCSHSSRQWVHRQASESDLHNACKDSEEGERQLHLDGDILSGTSRRPTSEARIDSFAAAEGMEQWINTSGKRQNIKTEEPRENGLRYDGLVWS